MFKNKPVAALVKKTQKLEMTTYSRSAWRKRYKSTTEITSYTGNQERGKLEKTEI